jgi:hypothetical protein
MTSRCMEWKRFDSSRSTRAVCRHTINLQPFRIDQARLLSTDRAFLNLVYTHAQDVNAGLSTLQQRFNGTGRVRVD